ncbi:MAG: molecular chaperone DnaK [Candidatus Bathyarchaeia archaeon]
MPSEVVAPEKILGIDLGTSNSAASVMSKGKPMLIQSADGITTGGKAFPSVVAFTKDGKLIVGEQARRQAVSNPEGTITAFKRKMGTDYRYKVWGREYAPQAISALLLEKIKKDAEDKIGSSIQKAVITVPAYFNDGQRQATKEAGSQAGLDVVRILNEPTAASLAYGLDKAGDHSVLVFDFGGGTLDVTILHFGGGVFEVKSTSGDTQLGGTDMDNVLVDYFLDTIAGESNIDLKSDSLAVARLLESAEKAKIELSSLEKTEVNVPFLAHVKGQSFNFRHVLTRGKLEELVASIIERCRRPTLQALSDSKLKLEDIDHVILVGGPTRMPIVQKFVEDLLKKRPEKGIDPMEVVASGAAIQGAVLAGEIRDILLLDVTPLSLGIETFGGLMNVIISRNTTIPTKAGELFTTAVDNQTRILVHVLQGEREMAADNWTLGRFSIDVDAETAGQPRVGVQFSIDTDGILHVLARDTKTGKENVVRMQSAVDISDARVEQMVKESVEHAKEDMSKRQIIELKMGAEQALQATVQGLKDQGHALTPEEVKAIEQAVAKMKTEILSEDYDRVKAAFDNLDKSTQRLANIMFQEVTKKTAEKSVPT